MMVKTRPKTVEEAIAMCDEGIQLQLVTADTALRFQDLLRDDDETLIKKFSEVEEALKHLSPQTQYERELVGRFWERAGKQLKDTKYHRERTAAFKNAMDWYDRARKHDRSTYVFEHLYLF